MILSFLSLAGVILAALLGASSANAITGEQLDRVPLRDNLERNDPPSGFSSSGMGAGKWSRPTAYVLVSSIGGAYNSGGRLGYGSPSFLSSAYWSAESFKDSGNGVAAETTLNSKLGNGESVAILLNQPSPTTVESGYELLLTGTANLNEGSAGLYKFSKGSLTLLASSGAYTATGTRYSLVLKNGELTAWGKFSGGTWMNPSPFQVTDLSPFKEGYAGLAVLGTGPSLANFSAGPLPPARPSVTATSPVSPNSSTTPKIIGSAEAGTEVHLYTNSSCSGSPVTNGSAAAFASPGLTASVREETTATFYAAVSNSEGVFSTCSATSVKYENDSAPPAKPALSWTDPETPGAKTSIHGGGGAEAGSTVKLYSGASCAGSVLVSGSASTFAESGLALTVSKNTTSTFSATATDAAGNVSACSSSISYVQDSAHILFEGSELSDFKELHECEPNRIGKTVDPLGSGKRVLYFTVYDTDTPGHGCSGTTPTENPRANAVSSGFVESGAEFWVHDRILIPSGFPKVPDWLSLYSLYGPPFGVNAEHPFGRTGPFDLEIDNNEFLWQRNESYCFDVPWTAPLETGKWMDLLIHEKFSEAGFLEIWWNGNKVKFFDSSNPHVVYTCKKYAETEKLEMKTMDETVNGGPNSFRIGQYRKVGMITEAATIYHQFVKVGTSKESVGG